MDVLVLQLFIQCGGRQIHPNGGGLDMCRWRVGRDMAMRFVLGPMFHLALCGAIPHLVTPGTSLIGRRRTRATGFFRAAFVRLLK
jgi:hypothetical protein